MPNWKAGNVAQIMFSNGCKTVTLNIKCSTVVFEAAMIAAHLQIVKNAIQKGGSRMNLQEHKEYNPEGKLREDISRT